VVAAAGSALPKPLIINRFERRRPQRATRAEAVGIRLTSWPRGSAVHGRCEHNESGSRIC
jgi:hypothetical protein